MEVITIIERNNHKVNLFMFIAPAGALITSFFQVVRSPNSSLGCFDQLEEAIGVLNNSISMETNRIEKPASFFTGIPEQQYD